MKASAGTDLLIGSGSANRFKVCWWIVSFGGTAGEPPVAGSLRIDGWGPMLVLMLNRCFLKLRQMVLPYAYE